MGNINFNPNGIEFVKSSAREIDGVVDNIYKPLITNAKKEGHYLLTPFHASAGATATFSNTQVSFIPIWIANEISVNAIVCKTSGTSNAGATFITGIYNESDTGGVGTLLVKSTVVSLIATPYSTYEAPIAQTILKAGKYWLAMSRSDMLATFYGCNAAMLPLIWTSVCWKADGNFMTTHTSFPAYAYSYNGDLPTDLSTVLVTSTSFGSIAFAPSLGLKLV